MTPNTSALNRLVAVYCSGLSQTSKDLFDYVEAVKISRKIWTDDILADHIGKEYLPGSEVITDDQIAEYLRNNVETCYHPVGTCAIGPDQDSALDTEFRLRGIGKFTFLKNYLLTYNSKMDSA